MTNVILKEKNIWFHNHLLKKMKKKCFSLIINYRTTFIIQDNFEDDRMTNQLIIP